MTKRPAPTGAGRSASSHRRPGPEKKLCLTATFAESPGRACRTILATKSTGFEASEAADASPTLAQPSIPVYKASAFVPFSYEIGQDAVNFTQELGKLLSDGYDQLTATAYTTGTGSNQPTGIMTALVASSPTVVVNTVGSNVLASGDIYALQNALPPRFQANAQWCASLTILNVLRQFETAAGALKFPGLQNNPPTLLGRSAHELSNMDPDFGSGENYVLVYGDFSNFILVDRYPSQVELIQNLVGANRRPTGSRGVFLWARTGSDSVVDNAFRVLNVPSNESSRGRDRTSSPTGTPFGRW